MLNIGKNADQVSSLIVLNHHESIEEPRLNEVKSDLNRLNPYAKIVLWNDLQLDDLRGLVPSSNNPEELDHLKAHWSSCSVDLPDPLSLESLNQLLKKVPSHILRVKGCTRLDDQTKYTYFERVPSGEVTMRPYYGPLITGPKLLAIGPGSDPDLLKQLIDETIHS